MDQRIRLDWPFKKLKIPNKVLRPNTTEVRLLPRFLLQFQPLVQVSVFDLHD